MYNNVLRLKYNLLSIPVINYVSNKKKFDLFKVPTKKYIEYKKEKNEFLQLYKQSRIKYYFFFSYSVMDKIIRKKLIHTVPSIFTNIMIMYMLSNTGVLNILIAKIKRK